VGVFEGVVVGALSLFKLDPTGAFAFALTAHVIQYLIIGILGSIGLARDGETLSGIYKQVRRMRSRPAE
jgi:hypothetical protein